MALNDRLNKGEYMVDKYYYCSGCKKFHAYDSNSHNPVNRKLCFFCYKVKNKKTEIIGNPDMGYSQICEECMSNIFE
jgi:hypothetical protein